MASDVRGIFIERLQKYSSTQYTGSMQILQNPSTFSAFSEGFQGGFFLLILWGFIWRLEGFF